MARITIDVPERKKALLERWGKAMGGNAATVVRLGAQHMLEVNDAQIAGIKASLADFKKNRIGVPHNEVVSWVQSWGTVAELPMPQGRKM